MHILTRKKGEGIVIGDGIIVSVVEIREDKARLSIECPKEELVHKGEVPTAIEQAMNLVHPR